jgi:hypothetical protein
MHAPSDLDLSKMTFSDHTIGVKATVKQPALFSFVQLLQESERQLNSLLCFDLAWFSSSDTPVVNMPTWELQKKEVENAIPQIHLKHSGAVLSS